MVGGQKGYWLSVDYVPAHGQPWLSHRAHCPPTKKLRVSESVREREALPWEHYPITSQEHQIIVDLEIEISV